MDRLCNLELTLLEAEELCKACGRRAMDHKNWPHNNPMHVNYDKRRAKEAEDLRRLQRAERVDWDPPPELPPKEVGLKYDDGKPRWDLLPFDVLEPVVRVLEYGANLYGEQNWRLVKSGESRYLNAALRHLIKHMSGEKIDPESGLPHLAHFVANGIFLLFFTRDET